MWGGEKHTHKWLTLCVFSWPRMSCCLCWMSVIFLASLTGKRINNAPSGMNFYLRIWCNTGILEMREHFSHIWKMSQLSPITSHYKWLNKTVRHCVKICPILSATKWRTTKKTWGRYCFWSPISNKSNQIWSNGLFLATSWLDFKLVSREFYPLCVSPYVIDYVFCNNAGVYTLVMFC